jgi:dipeptide/tripeptide permease
MNGSPRLATALDVLGLALVANSVLGPLWLDVIDYHYGEAMTNQGIGLDAVALVCAAPLAFVAASLVRHGHVGGPVVAFAPATFAAYMMPQYVVGADYLGLPGNNENAIPFHIATMVLAIGVFTAAWHALVGNVLPPDDVRSDHRRSWVLIGNLVSAVCSSACTCLPPSSSPRC